MTVTLFRHARVFDGWSEELIDTDVLVEGGLIRDLRRLPMPAGSA